MRKINSPILIFVDNLRRDYLVAEVIKNYFIKKKFKVFLISRENYRYAIKFIKSDLIIFIKNYFNSIPKDILANINKDTDIIVIDAEGAQTLERCKFWTEKYKIDVVEQTKRSKKIFLWNSDFLEYISNYTQTRPEKFHISGSPKINLSIVAKGIEKHEISKNIGFIGRFSAINDFADRSCLENSIVNFIALDEFRHGAKGEIETLFIYLDIFNEIINSTDLIINLRPHPNEKIESYNYLKRKYKNRIKISDPQEDFINWMYRQNKIICTPSTSIVEPILNNIPLISVHKIVKSTTLRAYVEDMIDPFLTKVYKPENIKNLLDLIKAPNVENLEDNKEYLEAQSKYYGDGKKIKKNAVSEIFDFFENSYTSEKNLLNFFNLLIYLFLNLKSFAKYLIFRNPKLKFTNDYNFFLVNKNNLSNKILHKLLNEKKNY